MLDFSEKILSQTRPENKESKKIKMPCAIAVANSPVFSSSPRPSPIFRKPSLPFNLNLHGSTPSPSSSRSSSSFQLSPLTFHVHKNQLSNDYNTPASTSSSPPMLLKRKRPSRIDIPIASLVIERPAVVDRLNEVEFEGEGYSVYCKRGKRGAMEDRYSAVVGLQGDSKQVKLISPFKLINYFNFDF